MSERNDVLTDDVRRLIEGRRLCSEATVDSDGALNLSARGTLVAWDAGTRAFAAVRSPRTLANLRVNPRIAVTIVEPIARTGDRFKGAAAVQSDGPVFEREMRLSTERGVVSAIRSRIGIHVTDALPMISPLRPSGLGSRVSSARLTPSHAQRNAPARSRHALARR